MKKYTPYLLPLVVLSVVFFLVFRWYNTRTDQAEPELFGEGVQIENLSEEELQETVSGSDDLETVELEQVAPEQVPTETDEPAEPTQPRMAEGVIRYNVQDDRARFSVVATLPMGEMQNYQVWIQDVDGEDSRHVFALTQQKGGFLGSASIPVDQLPLEVLVTRGSETELGEVLLRGQLAAPTTQ